MSDVDPRTYAGVGTGPLREGERVTLTDAKGRRHSILLVAGGAFHTTKGGIAHDDLIGGPDGVVVHSVGGTPYLALRPLLAEWTVTMPRGAAVVYPKDAAQIVGGRRSRTGFDRIRPEGRRSVRPLRPC